MELKRSSGLHARAVQAQVRQPPAARRLERVIRRTQRYQQPRPVDHSRRRPKIVIWALSWMETLELLQMLLNTCPVCRRKFFSWLAPNYN